MILKKKQLEWALESHFFSTFVIFIFMDLLKDTFLGTWARATWVFCTSNERS